MVKTRLLQHDIDVWLMRTVEHRRCDRHAALHLLAEANDALVVIVADWLVPVVVGDDRLDRRPQRLDIALAAYCAL
jgi:hypothetical protein